MAITTYSVIKATWKVKDLSDTEKPRMDHIQLESSQKKSTIKAFIRNVLDKYLRLEAKIYLYK